MFYASIASSGHRLSILPVVYLELRHLGSGGSYLLGMVLWTIGSVGGIIRSGTLVISIATSLIKPGMLCKF